MLAANILATYGVGNMGLRSYWQRGKQRVQKNKYIGYSDVVKPGQQLVGDV